MHHLPNIITAARIVLLTPAIVLLFFYGYALSAFFVALAAALSDYIDGRLARYMNTTSELGEVLDPAADKVFCLTTLTLAIVHFQHGFLLWLPVLIIALYDVAATLMRLMGIISKASVVAKWKTAGIMVALLLFLLSIAVTEALAQRALIILFYMTLYVSAYLTVLSGINYVKTARRQPA